MLSEIETEYSLLLFFYQNTGEKHIIAFLLFSVLTLPGLGGASRPADNISIMEYARNLKFRR